MDKPGEGYKICFICNYCREIGGSTEWSSLSSELVVQSVISWILPWVWCSQLNTHWCLQYTGCPLEHIIWKKACSCTPCRWRSVMKGWSGDSLPKFASNLDHVNADTLKVTIHRTLRKSMPCISSGDNFGVVWKLKHPQCFIILCIKWWVDTGFSFQICYWFTTPHCHQQSVKSSGDATVVKSLEIFPLLRPWSVCSLHLTRY